MEEEVIVLMEIVDERVTLRGVGRAWVAFVRTMARWTHHHWNFIAWPVDAILGIVVAIATFQGTWQFIWSAVLDERSWPPEITLFVIKPLVGVLLGAAWLHLVLATGNAGRLRKDSRLRGRNIDRVAAHIVTGADTKNSAADHRRAAGLAKRDTREAWSARRSRLLLNLTDILPRATS